MLECEAVRNPKIKFQVFNPLRFQIIVKFVLFQCRKWGILVDEVIRQIYNRLWVLKTVLQRSKLTSNGGISCGAD